MTIDLDITEGKWEIGKKYNLFNEEIIAAACVPELLELARAAEKSAEHDGSLYWPLQNLKDRIK